MGFLTTHYCSDCTWMTENEAGRGKFKCESKCPYNEVYADQTANNCRTYVDAWSRSSRRKEELYNVSRRSHYLVTAISDILGLGDDNKYHTAYEYMRDVYIPVIGEEGEYFMDDYNDLAPICAEYLINDEEKALYAEYLRGEYLEPFYSLIEMHNNQAAFELYDEMFTTIKNKYGVRRLPSTTTLLSLER